MRLHKFPRLLDGGHDAQAGPDEAGEARRRGGAPAPLGGVEHVQDLLYGKVVPEVNSFHDVDYGAIASAFGANGFRVTDVDGFERALAVGLERRAPTIIDAVIDRGAIAPVTRYDRVRIREL